MSLRPGMEKAKCSCPSRKCSELVSCWMTSPGKAFSLSRERRTCFVAEGCGSLSVWSFQESLEQGICHLCVPRACLVWVAVSQCCRKRGWWCREQCPSPALGRGPAMCHLWSPGFVPARAVQDSCCQKHLCALKDAATWTKTPGDNFESNQ